MSDLKMLKRMIYEDDRIEEILEALGCEEIHHSGEYIMARRPNGRKNRSVQVKLNENLSSYVRSQGIEGDIYSLVSYLRSGLTTKEEWDKDLPKAKKWLAETLGYWQILRDDYTPPPVYNDWLRNIKKKRSKKINLAEIKQNPVLSEDIPKREWYEMIPHMEWVNEGIHPSVQMLFEVGFDHFTNRIITLIRNSNGELIGVKGRTVEDRYKELGIPKYLYLINFDKHIELYNLHRAKKYIEAMGYVLVFEGYKSVMKAFQAGFPNAVSIEGNTISAVQAEILRQLGQDIDIVLCFDKDRYIKIEVDSKGNQKMVFDGDFILKKSGANLLRKRKVKALIDTSNLLGMKDSPIDKGKHVFEELMKKKFLVPIDEAANR